MIRPSFAAIIAVPASLCLTAAAWADPIPVQRPAFCEGHTANPAQDRYVASYIGKQGISDDLVNRMAMSACDAPGDPARQQKLAEHRKVLADRWGISPAMTLESLKLRLDLPAYKSEMAAFCKKSKKVADASDRENAANAAWSRAVGCDNNFNFSWFLDEQAEASQVWRLAMTLQCYPPRDYDKFDENEEFSSNMKKAGQLTRYARCAVDVNRLDRAKLEAELAADSRVTPRVKVAVLETFDQTKSWTDKVTAAYRELGAKNAEYKEVLFDLPEKAYASWVERYGAAKADFDQVIEVERRASEGKGAVKGCSVKLRPGFARFLAGRKVQTKDEFTAIGYDGFGVRWLRALGFCEQIDGNHALGVYLSHEVRPGSTRGPRVEAEQAAAAQIARLRVDNPRFSDDGRAFATTGENDVAKALDSIYPVQGFILGSGVIESIDKKGEQRLITFKTVTWTQPKWICHDTDKIERIDFDNGKLQYRQSCKEDGTEKLSSKEEPILLPAAYAAALKPGQFLTFIAPGIDPREGLALAGYADPKQSKVVSLFGLAP